MTVYSEEPQEGTQQRHDQLFASPKLPQATSRFVFLCVFRCPSFVSVVQPSLLYVPPTLILGAPAPGSVQCSPDARVQSTDGGPGGWFVAAASLVFLVELARGRGGPSK